MALGMGLLLVEEMLDGVEVDEDKEMEWKNEAL